jgi:hypothetical protein
MVYVQVVVAHNVECLSDTFSCRLICKIYYDRFLPKAIDLVDRASAKKLSINECTEGSVIASIVNAGLNNIEVYVSVPFRRGDILNFSFQEIENAFTEIFTSLD